MEDNHLNLYHDVSKEDVYEYISNIKNIDKLNRKQFDYELLKFFALFKDAHTTYQIPWLFIDKKIIYIDGKAYLESNEKFCEILSIGNYTTQEFIDKIKPLMNYETQEWLNHKIENGLMNGYFYQLLDLCEPFEILTVEGKFEINIINRERAVELGIIPAEKKFYSYKIMGNNIIYIQYARCEEKDDYPFISFVQDLKKIIEDNNITQYILDLRGNMGGNSEILNPFQELVAQKQMKGVLLIDNEVFSSGRFAVARFKKQFNTPLIGQGTGGAAKSYGYNKRLNVEDVNFSVSIRLWDFSETFGYEGSIKPDFYIPNTIEDIENKKDKQLDFALQYFNKEKSINRK